MLDNFLLLAFTLFVIRGAWAGDTAELRSSLTWIITVAGATFFHPLLRNVSSGIPIANQAGTILSFAACSLVAFPVVYILMSYIAVRFTHHREQLAVNRAIGAGFAFIRGMAILVCICSVLAQFPLKSAAVGNSVIVRSLAIF